MIRFENVSVSYGSIRALISINLEIEKGQITGIAGENGGGKSTLLKACINLIPYEGDIWLDDKKLRLMSRKERAKRITYLPQNRPIPAMDVRTLIAHGRFPYTGFSHVLTRRDEEILAEAAERAGVTDLLDRQAAELSGGERQRVYMAMALAQDTDIILLDEPTTFMDVRHQIEVMDLLKNLKKMGKTVVFTSHDLPLVFTISDRVAVLQSKTIAAVGSPKTVAGSDVLETAFGAGLAEAYHEKAPFSYQLIRRSP